MDFSKLSQNDKTAALASAVLVVAGLIAASTYTTYALTWLAILAAVAMLLVVLQPQIAPKANLPGSKGTLMVALGGIAGGVMVIALLTTLTFIFVAFGFADILFLAAILAGVVMAWTGWTAFQAEGGKFQLGSSSAAAPPTTAAPEAPAAAPDRPVAADPAPAPATEPAATGNNADDYRPRDDQA
jgi:predicted lipid-binding transport protein (Tim44 family)